MSLAPPKGDDEDGGSRRASGSYVGGGLHHSARGTTMKFCGDMYQCISEREWVRLQATSGTLAVDAIGHLCYRMYVDISLFLEV